jgi:osomolarity two-component system response regulator SKN7
MALADWSQENGADAYTRVTNMGRDHFDLMFMDIIMPRLDGVSATMYIRQHCPTTPIIAMTSNIRPDEVNGYFEHGKSQHLKDVVKRSKS